MQGGEFTEAESIGELAFGMCPKLKSVSFPKVTHIAAKAFENATSLVEIKLPLTPPVVSNKNAFTLKNGSFPANRHLIFVDADGIPLTDKTLEQAQINYRNINDGNKKDNLWYGWNIVPQTTTAHFETNGGNTIASTELNADRSITKPADPVRFGYQFTAWYADASLQNVWNFETDTVPDGISQTLFAKWEGFFYDIEYNSKNGTGTMEPSKNI